MQRKNQGNNTRNTKGKREKSYTDSSQKKSRTSASGKRIAQGESRSSETGKRAAQGKSRTSAFGKQTGKGKSPSSKPGMRSGQHKTHSSKVYHDKMEGNGGDDLVRLNKYIANTGLCSRRQADEYIVLGEITVNGEAVTELGTKVSPKDDVRYNGRRLGAEKKVYILMNKPKDTVTTVKDKNAKYTVIDLLGKNFNERIYPVGRLDRNTTGVLLLTNDGDLATKLTHPKYKKKKVYQAKLDKPLSKTDLEQMVKGIKLEDGLVTADAVSFINNEDKTEVGVELHSGKNRVIRRIFEALGYKIRKLDRVYFAGLTKKGLTRGRWRYLTREEISKLKMNAFN